MSGREFRNVFENLRLRQRKSLGRSSLVNPNKPNAGAGYALRLSACCSRLRTMPPVPEKGRPPAAVIPFQKPITVRSNCEPGTIRESSVGSDGKHCCGGKWPKRFYLLSAEILCKSGCRSFPFYGSFLRGTRPVQLRGLPPILSVANPSVVAAVENQPKCAPLTAARRRARNSYGRSQFMHDAQQPCNE